MSNSNPDKENQSHIQIPKLLLKRFANKNGVLSYYDVQKKVFGLNGHPRTLNTEVDYYSSLGEKYWNTELETDLSKLLKALDSINTDAPRSTFPLDFNVLSKKYLYSLMARSPIAHKKAEETSVYLQLVEKKFQHDIASSTIYSLAIEQNDFDQWIPTLLVNKSETPFILPMCGYVEYSYKGIDEYIVMLVDPYKAIQLIPPSAINLYVDSDHIKYSKIEKSSIIMQLNHFCFESQVKLGYGYVVSRDMKVLKDAEQNR